MENADPLASLTAEELARANARRAFALDAAEGVEQDALIKRLQSVLSGGERAEIAAYLAAGSRVRGRIIERPHERAMTEAGTPAARAPGGSVSYTPLDDVLGQMRGALLGEQSSRLEAEQDRQQQASSVELAAGNLQVGVRSAAEAHWQRNYGNQVQRLHEGRLVG